MHYYYMYSVHVCLSQDKALGWIPLGFGIVVDDEPFKFLNRREVPLGSHYLFNDLRFACDDIVLLVHACHISCSMH